MNGKEAADQAALQALPASLQRLAETVGYNAALTLARHFGGVRLYVPASMPPDHLLARLIGIEAAQRLAAEYGGQQHFDIPRARAPALREMIEERNAAIRAKFRMGKSQYDLALEYAMSRRWVQEILQEDDPVRPATQSDLFQTEKGPE